MFLSWPSYRFFRTGRFVFEIRVDGDIALFPEFGMAFGVAGVDDRIGRFADEQAQGRMVVFEHADQAGGQFDRVAVPFGEMGMQFFPAAVVIADLQIGKDERGAFPEEVRPEWQGSRIRQRMQDVEVMVTMWPDFWRRMTGRTARVMPMVPKKFGFELLADLFVGRFLEVAEQAVSGIVDEYVDAPECVQCGGYGLLDVAGKRQVEFCGQQPAVFWQYAGECFGPACCGDNAVALFQCLAGDFQSHALGGASDEEDGIFSDHDVFLSGRGVSGFLLSGAHATGVA